MLDSNAGVENWQLYPVSQFRGSFEHVHDDEHEDEHLVATPLFCGEVVLYMP